MSSLPRWLIDAVFLALLFWAIEREIGKVKKWVEGLVGAKKQDEPEVSTPCIACGKPSNEDYADCPTCGRHWKDVGLCGQRWTEGALRSTTGRQEQPQRIVKAEEFILVDSNGKARARLGMEDGDSPTLALMYEDGSRPNYFMMTPTGAELRLGNRDGEEIMLVVGDYSGRQETYAYAHIADRHGYTTTIGRGRRREDEIDRETWAKLAASSVVLSKDGEVIWSAP
jgi:hypothetical protein